MWYFTKGIPAPSVNAADELVFAIILIKNGLPSGAADDMRSWGRVKPEKRLDPRPEQLPRSVAKVAIVPDRPWRKAGEKWSASKKLDTILT